MGEIKARYSLIVPESAVKPQPIDYLWKISCYNLIFSY